MLWLPVAPGGLAAEATAIAAPQWLPYVGLLLAMFTALLQWRAWRLNRLSIGLQAVVAQDTRLSGSEFANSKGKAAAYLAPTNPKQDAQGKQAVIELLNFFEGIGFQLTRGLVSEDAVWHFFGSDFIPFFYLCQKANLMSEFYKADVNLYDQVTCLNDRMLSLEGKRHPSKSANHCFQPEFLEQFLSGWRESGSRH